MTVKASYNARLSICSLLEQLWQKDETIEYLKNRLARISPHECPTGSDLRKSPRVSSVGYSNPSRRGTQASIKTRRRSSLHNTHDSILEDLPPDVSGQMVAELKTKVDKLEHDNTRVQEDLRLK